MAVDFNAACVALAHRLADTSGEIVLGYFRKPLAVEDKADAISSPVTIADRDSEAAMRDIIRATFPDHGVIGEEHGSHNPDAEWTWVLDPIDGTQSFINGVPLFGTLIGLLHMGVPWFGCINHPALNQRWIGGANLPTTMNGEPCRVRAGSALAQATVYATGAEYLAPDEAAAFDRLAAKLKKRRYGGTDCFHYAMVASGWTDMACEARLALHDFAAVVPVIQNAGGTVTDWTGRALVKGSSGHILAAGDAPMHAAALKALAWTG
ncbi:MAG: histidinol-phosphatase [Alphaproteobacteria bacterium]|nr:histidinol-phosphatase [Alphaproteobacteria bacterium]